jgi:hypothetical protein
MLANEYLEALHKARTELDDLMIQRSEMDARISQLEITIDGLAALCNTADLAEKTSLDVSAGVTEAIRTVLQQTNTAMTAPQIRDTLLDMGYDTGRYASILTVIHNTIRRMNDQGEIWIVQNGGRFAGWRYRKPAEQHTPGEFKKQLMENLKRK